MDRFYLTNAIYSEAFNRGRQEYVRTIEEALKKYLDDVDLWNQEDFVSLVIPEDKVSFRVVH